jgi:hypothetical protein
MNATPTPVSHTVWNPPGALFPIRYSLALFREIDHFVGDGYRRIPHGGLEVGAVLYGHGDPAELTIEAFRPIESQHSFGPSFTLSAMDLEQLAKQAAAPLLTEAGDELEVVGWLVSNCRSDLALTEQESQIYDEYFPGPRQVTLLAKPEKFKPTRYGFLSRPLRGTLLEKACRDSFILPLSTKGDATALREPVEETPAPRPSAVSLPQVHTREVEPHVSTPPPPATVTPSAPPPVIPATPPPPPAEAAPAPVFSEDVRPEPPVPLAATAVQVPDVRAEIPPTLIKTSPIGSTASALPDNVHSQRTNSAAISAESPREAAENLTSPVRERPSSVRPGFLMLQSEPPVTASQPEAPTESIPESPQPSRAFPLLEVSLAVAILILLAAGVLWTYMHLPAPAVPLNAEVQPGQVVVTWSPELTKNAEQCSITTWTNGQASSKPLSADEQSEGKVVIQAASPDVTIQLHAPYWYKDHTGQIRIFRITPSTEPVLTKPAKRVFASPEGGNPVPPLVGVPANSVPKAPRE